MNYLKQDGQLVVNYLRQPVVRSASGSTVLVQAPEHIVSRPTFDARLTSLCDQGLSDVTKVCDSLDFLELDFTLVLIEHRTMEVFAANGYRNVMSLFFRRSDQAIEVRDDLPRFRTREEAIDNISIDRLKSFIASGWATGPFEYSDSIQSINRGWMRIPPGKGVLLTRKNVDFVSFDNIFAPFFDEVSSPASLAEELRDAVDRHLGELALTGPLFSEFSGGIDSGVVMARAQRTQGKRLRGGLACHFPYHEFQREETFRRDIAQHIGARTYSLDPEDFMPFLLHDAVPPHDEPTLVSTSWSQFRSSAELSERHGGRVVLTGHGGDTLFRFAPSKPLVASIPTDFLSWFPQRVGHDIRDCALHISERLNMFSRYGFAGLWHPSMFDSGIPARFILNAGIDVRMVSGLLSRDTLQAAARLWAHPPQFATGVQKPFAHYVFANDLPPSVWSRPGKVDHLGIVFRGMRDAGASLNCLADRNIQVLELLGVKAKEFRKFLAAAIHGRDAGNPILSQLLAILIWLDQYGKPSEPQASRVKLAWKIEAQVGFCPHDAEILLC